MLQRRAGSPGAGPTRLDPVRVLATAVDGAIAALKPGAPAGPVLESMLTGFTEAVAPAQAAIAELAVRDPGGPLKMVQDYLGNAFAWAVSGDVEATRAALIAARAALFHLDDPDDAFDQHHWRF